MKLQRALWFYFGFFRELLIKSRYKQTPKGNAEQERLYWARRIAYTRRLSEG